MMRCLPLVFLVGLGGCSQPVVSRLEQTKWGNDAQPCSENYATFSDGEIAFHPRSGERIAVWKIVRIDSSWLHPSEVAVEIEPTERVLAMIKDRGIGRFRLTLNLRIEGDKLRIPSVTARNRTTPVPAGDSLTMFNAFACPS